MRKPCHRSLLCGRPARIGYTDDAFIRLMDRDLVTYALITVEHPIAYLCILPAIHDLIGIVNAESREVLERLKAIEPCFVLP